MPAAKVASFVLGGIERSEQSIGKRLWERKAPEAKPETGLWPKNTYATATPVTDGERVVAFLGSCGLDRKGIGHL